MSVISDDTPGRIGADPSGYAAVWLDTLNMLRAGEIAPVAPEDLQEVAIAARTAAEGLRLLAESSRLPSDPLWLLTPSPDAMRWAPQPGGTDRSHP